MKSMLVAGLLAFTTPVFAATEQATVQTPSGLSYQVIKEGEGASPQDGQKVIVHYTGWLKQTNEKFDSSFDRKEPFRFTLGKGEVIPGWDEGIATMKVGEKRKLIVPGSLAYGAYGIPGAIPPNATLVFDVELLGIE